MLQRLRFALMNARTQSSLLNSPPVQPMYDAFRVPVLTPEEAFDAKRRQNAQRTLAERMPRFHVERLT